MFSSPGTGAGFDSRSRKPIAGPRRGRWCAIATLLVVFVSPLATEPLFGAAETTERTLFLLLDAVPYGTLAALERRGFAPELFEELGQPVPLISSFPSTTTVALADALGPLGLQASPGYEARFFDWSEDRPRGGGLISYFRIEFPWREFFQWSKKGVARSALASLRPAGASENRVRSALSAFLESQQRNFFAYIETTDTAAHLKGPESLDETLRELGRAIRAARAEGDDFKVVVFSDHGIDGGDPLVNVLPAIRTDLRKAGLRKSARLERPTDVVLTPYGLVSSFEAYAQGELAPRLTAILVATEGVELCSYRSEGKLWVASRDGAAVIARRGDDWAYRPVTGDPLFYQGVAQRLDDAAARGSAGDWYSDRDWFEASKNELYPDALRRLARGFELVENPATVICSVAPGYMYGARKTERAARLTGGRLRWTHGGLSRGASVGFVLTDVPSQATGNGLRLSEFLLPLVSLRPVSTSVAGVENASPRVEPRVSVRVQGSGSIR